jgi:predicted nucleic acid-binding protein
LRVVFDTQVWLRGLLAKDPNSIGSTLLQAVRDRLFVCVGSAALISEVDEKLSAPARRTSHIN